MENVTVIETWHHPNVGKWVVSCLTNTGRCVEIVAAATLQEREDFLEVFAKLYPDATTIRHVAGGQGE